MSYRNRTGLGGLLIGCSLAVASACGGLDSVTVIVTPDDGGTGNAGGGQSSAGKPSGGDGSSEGGAAGAGAADSAGAAGTDVPGSAGTAGEEASGGEGGQIVVPDPMPGPPSVVTVLPLDGAASIDPIGTIRIAFSEPLDPASVTRESVQLKDEAGALVTGAVEYADAVATFKPIGRLNLLGKYTVNVSTAVTDAGKTPMTRPFLSSFTVRDGEWRRTEAQLTDSTAAFDRSSVVSLATDGVGRATAVWAQASDGSGYDVFAASFLQGKGWGTPVKVNTNVANCQYPNVAMNSSGNALVGWIEYDATLGYSVQARRIISGTWDKTSSKVDAPTTPSLSTYPSGVVVALTNKGESHVSWLHYIYDATAAVNYYGQNTRHADAAGTWDASVTKFAYQVSTGTSQPSLAFDDAGNGFAAYQFSTSTNKTNTLVFRYVADTGKWGASAVSGAGSEDYPMPVALATNSAGEAVVSWARGTVVDATTSNYDLMGAYFNKAWSTPVVLSNTKTAIASSKTMASAVWTGASFWVAWAQSAGSSYNVYVNEHKTAAWGAPAIISDGKHSAAFPWLAADGRGNALVVWSQASDATPPANVIPVDIVFSRFVGAAGKWSDSALVSRAVAGYRFPQVVTLADGASLAAWQRIVQIPKNVNATGVLENVFQ